MEGILSITLVEILCIVILAFILIKPQEYEKIGRLIGKMLRSIIASEQWKSVQRATNGIRNMPNELIREAGLEEIQKDSMNTQVNEADNHSDNSKG